MRDRQQAEERRKLYLLWSSGTWWFLKGGWVTCDERKQQGGDRKHPLQTKRLSLLLTTLPGSHSQVTESTNQKPARLWVQVNVRKPQGQIPNVMKLFKDADTLKILLANYISTAFSDLNKGRTNINQLH